jgi:S-DNA-T family DNA segregation ATPase FtsK/SpoIIIE
METNIELPRMFDKQYKAIAILLFLFSFLLLLALISYSVSDEKNIQISFFDLFKLFSGDQNIDAKASTTSNWLGLVGAYLADFFYNGTLGYYTCTAPLLIIFWCKFIYSGKEINHELIKFTTVYAIIGILFSGFAGSLQTIPFLSEIPKQWSGAIGQFLAYIISGLIGSIGSVMLFAIGMVLTLYLGTEIKISYGDFNLKTFIYDITIKIKNDFRKIFSKKKVDESISDDLTKNDVNSESDVTNTGIIEFESSKNPFITESISSNNDNIKNLRKTPNININNPIDLKSQQKPVNPFKTIQSDAKKNVEKEVEREVEKEIITEVVKDEPAPLQKIDMKPVTKTDAPIKPLTIEFNKPKVEEYTLKKEIIEIDKPEIAEEKIIPKFKPNFKNLQNNSEVVTSVDENIKDELINLVVDLKKDIQKKKIEPIIETVDEDEDEEDIFNLNEPYENVLDLDDSLIVPQKEIIAESQDKRIIVKVHQRKDDSRQPQQLLGTSIHDEDIDYTPPNFDLLISEQSQTFVNDDELRTNAQILQEKLETFKIYIENLSVTPGPVVTQYEFVPAAGIKISKIESLADDLAMALKARGIRIIAPIPGKGTIGVEIPNNTPSIVRFGETVNSNKFISSTAKLPLAMGKTISGEVFILDLTKMPHLLIAGSTGSGKSVGINAIITSLVYKMHPSELKFVIIDPKKVELQQYAALKNHFMAASPDIRDTIVTKPEDAVTVLKSAVAEMELRYDILASCGQRNISDYNEKIRSGKIKDTLEIAHKPMPYIVVIIDELADLMLTASKEIEEPITRLAQMARAIGIHLVVATQRPSVDVITGIIKANFPARIAYLVASKIDSRTILDMQGAEQLLGMGDMLCLPPGQPKPVRVQNAYISTEEVDNICDFIGNQRGYSEPYMLPSLVEKSSKGPIDPSDRDPLFEEAARLIIRNQQGSVSLLQRRLKVGYARAGRIVDELESAGVVGPFDGSKSRLVLMESESDLEAVL